MKHIDRRRRGDIGRINDDEAVAVFAGKNGEAAELRRDGAFGVEYHHRRGIIAAQIGDDLIENERGLAGSGGGKAPCMLELNGIGESRHFGLLGLQRQCEKHFKRRVAQKGFNEFRWGKGEVSGKLEYFARFRRSARRYAVRDAEVLKKLLSRVCEDRLVLHRRR